MTEPAKAGRKPEKPEEWVAQFAVELGLPADFFMHLIMKEDDWSFIIKLHALVEAAVSHTLSATCGEKLLDVFTRLDLSSDSIGKLAFAKALDLLDKADRRFIRTLSEIRNDFAHDVRQAGTTLNAYVSKLTPNQLKAFRDAVGPGGDIVDFGKVKISAVDFVRENPKLAIWLRALFMIALIYQRKDLALLKRALEAERDALWQEKKSFAQLVGEMLMRLKPTGKTSPDDAGL